MFRTATVTTLGARKVAMRGSAAVATVTQVLDESNRFAVQSDDFRSENGEPEIVFHTNNFRIRNHGDLKWRT
jgi:hypothetical protein